MAEYPISKIAFIGIHIFAVPRNASQMVRREIKWYLKKLKIGKLWYEILTNGFPIEWVAGMY